MGAIEATYVASVASVAAIPDVSTADVVAVAGNLRVGDVANTSAAVPETLQSHVHCLYTAGAAAAALSLYVANQYSDGSVGPMTDDAAAVLAV